MLSKLVLILDKRKELPAKYKKLVESSNANVIIKTNFEETLACLNEYEPDLVLVSDSVEQELSEIVKKLRMMSYSSRPCIIAISKSAELQDKLKTLDAGADDFLSEPIESEEFKARINAHLRRHFAANIEETTQLPDVKSALKVLKRTISQSSENKWAGLLVKINNFIAYREIYGELAADKMLQTYTAIINSSLEATDFLAMVADGEFLILTVPVKAERIASFLVYAFDSIVEKFYSEEDAKQGYIILYGDDNAGKRVNLVSTGIGVISSEFQNYSNVNNAMDALVSACKLASFSTKSAYIAERAQISAQNAVENKVYNNKILIIEPDEALNYLLKTTGEMQGYEVCSTESYESAFEMIKQCCPAVIILDAGDFDDLEGLEICKKIKSTEGLKEIKIILSTVVHDKKLALNAGADLYLPKPYELLGVFNWLEHFIKDYNN